MSNYTIKMDPSVTGTLKTKTTQANNDCAETANSLGPIINTLSGIQFSGSGSLTSRVTSARGRLIKQTEVMKQIAQFVGVAESELVDADAAACVNSVSVWSRVKSALSSAGEKVLSFLSSLSIAKQAAVVGVFLSGSTTLVGLTILSLFKQWLGKDYGGKEQNTTKSTDSEDSHSESSVKTNDYYDIPSRQSLPITPYKTNDAQHRNPDAYSEVMESLDVENTDRYRIGNNNTWCNIYVWDVTTAMGCEIPHYYDKITGEPLTREYCLQNPGTYFEMSALRMTTWLSTYGSKYGWIECDSATAIEKANCGLPTVVAATEVGHVAMVAPQNAGESGVMISQAGLNNYAHTSLKNGFGNYDVKYFYHI